MGPKRSQKGWGSASLASRIPYIVIGALALTGVIFMFIPGRPTDPTAGASRPRLSFAVDEKLAPGTELHLARVVVGGVPLRRAPYVAGETAVRVYLKYRVDKDRGGPLVEVERPFLVNVPVGPHGAILRCSVKEDPALPEAERFSVALRAERRPEEPEAPKLLPPDVGEAQVYVRPEVRLPEGAAAPGKSLYLMAKVCVEDTGDVREVTIMKGENPIVDAAVIDGLSGRLYRPFLIRGRPVPFCHPLRMSLKVGRT